MINRYATDIFDNFRLPEQSSNKPPDEKEEKCMRYLPHVKTSIFEVCEYKARDKTVKM